MSFFLLSYRIVVESKSLAVAAHFDARVKHANLVDPGLVHGREPVILEQGRQERVPAVRVRVARSGEA